MNNPNILKKLHVLKAKNALIIGLPQELSSVYQSLSYDDEPTRDAFYDFVQIYALDQRDLREKLDSVHNSMKYDGYFWISYPKGTGKIKSDLKRDIVWAAFQSIDQRAVTAISIDDTWTALRGRPISSKK